MYYFEQLLYEAAPQIPSPKPVSYVQPKQQQAIKAQASQQQVQAPVQQAPVQQAPVQQAPVQQVQSQQAQAPQDYSEEDLASFENEEGTEDESAEDDNAAGLVPIKRYFLIQRLFTLNDKLNQLRIKNDVLNLVITFIDSFSYASLLSLSNKLVEDIYLQVKGSTEGATNAQ
jgi:hypothetical protein